MNLILIIFGVTGIICTVLFIIGLADMGTFGLVLFFLFFFVVVPIIFVSGIAISVVLYFSWLTLFYFDKLEKLIFFIQGL